MDEVVGGAGGAGGTGGTGGTGGAGGAEDEEKSDNIYLSQNILFFYGHGSKNVEKTSSKAFYYHTNNTNKTVITLTAFDSYTRTKNVIFLYNGITEDIKLELKNLINKKGSKDFPSLKINLEYNWIRSSFYKILSNEQILLYLNDFLKNLLDISKDDSITNKMIDELEEDKLKSIKEELFFDVRIYKSNTSKNLPLINITLDTYNLCEDLNKEESKESEKLFIKSGIFNIDYNPFNISDSCDKKKLFDGNIFPKRKDLDKSKKNKYKYKLIDFLNMYNKKNPEDEIIIMFICQHIKEKEKKIHKNTKKLYRQRSDNKQLRKENKYFYKYLKYKDKYLELKKSL